MSEATNLPTESFLVLAIQCAVDILVAQQSQITLRGLYDKIQTAFDFTQAALSGSEGSPNELQGENVSDLSDETTKESPAIEEKRRKILCNGLTRMIFIGKIGGNFFVAGGATRMDDVLLPEGGDIVFGDCRAQHFLRFQEGIEIWDKTIIGADDLAKEISVGNMNWSKADEARIDQSGQAFIFPEFRSCGPCAKCRRLHQYRSEFDANEREHYDRGGKSSWEFYGPLHCAEDQFALELKLNKTGRSTRKRSG